VKKTPQAGHPACGVLYECTCTAEENFPAGEAVQAAPAEHAGAACRDYIQAKPGSRLAASFQPGRQFPR